MRIHYPRKAKLEELTSKCITLTVFFTIDTGHHTLMCLTFDTC